MNKQEAINILKRRKGVFNSIDKLIKSTKKTKEEDKKNEDQLDLFSVGLEVEVVKPEIKPYEGNVDLIDLLKMETELLGFPVTWTPLDDIADIYYDLFTTHAAYDILQITEETKGIIFIDYVVDIEHRVSKKGNKYAKIRTSMLNGDDYMFLFVEQFKTYIPQLFNYETYMIMIDYNEPNKDYSKHSLVIKHVKNIKDIDVDAEIERLKTLYPLISSKDDNR